MCRVVGLSFVVLSLLLSSGCSVIPVKPEGRVASDQMLIALAIEDAVASLDLAEHVRGRNVQIQVTGLSRTPEDSAYLAEALRARVRMAGGVVTESSCELTLIAMAQAVGSDAGENEWGLPIALPTLRNFAMSTFKFYQSDAQVARCRLWVYGMDSSGALLFAIPPAHFAHYITNPRVLGMTLGRTSDLRELRRTRGAVRIRNKGLLENDPNR